MRGQHRFLRTKGGITSFAWVEVDATPQAQAGVAVAEELPEKPNTDAGEMNRRFVPDWVDAAVDGIKVAGQYMQSFRTVPMGWQLTLVKLVGTGIETRADAVRCAAAKATQAAMMAAYSWEAPPPPLEVVYKAGKWTIEPAAPSTVGVQGTAS